MAEETGTSRKRKVWVRIVGPSEFKNNALGESYVNEAGSLVGKKLKLDLSSLLGDMRRQNIAIGFIIKEVSGNQAKAEAISYNISNAHIRRMVRAGKEKLESSFIVDIKDSKKIKVKTLVLTKAKTKNSILTAIRKGINNYFAEFGKNSNFNDVLGNLIDGELIKSLRMNIKKIYPLSVLEVKSVELLK